MQFNESLTQSSLSRLGKNRSYLGPVGRMSKAAHNSCQAGAEIPTGTGMHKKSTFTMSRLRHKQEVGEDVHKQWHLFGYRDFPIEHNPST